jgi:tetratricopeptide (TPR) repeat protein
MNMQHADTLAGKPTFRLTVIQGLDRGKKFDLETNRQYLMGRAEECDIRIDLSDKTVSRRHAQLYITDKHIIVENLSAANPVLINGKPVKKSTLKDKAQFQIGNSLFVVEKTAKPAASGGGRAIPPLRIVLIAALVIISAGLFFIMMNDSKEPAGTDINMTTSFEEMLPELPTALPDKDMSGNGFSATGLNVSAEDMKKADQHFRQGMFFYDTGNLSRAVDEWNQAVIFYPDHADAQTWFLRAERELEEKVKTHYQNAMLHYKYMRYNDAAHEFRLVVELSRNKNSDQYINALKSLNEIEGK